jgi:uncharacterized protein (UPF0218 family)
MPRILAKLPGDLRSELKEPLGEIYTDTDAMLAEAGDTVVAVGDIVTYHLLEADRRPDVAIVDEKTQRERVERAVLDAIDGFDDRIEVVNPPAVVTEELLAAIAGAVDESGTVVVAVDGEEDLAVLPAVLAAPEDAAVVYGQPDEGMVLTVADAETRERCRDLLGRMEGDLERIEDALDV